MTTMTPQRKGINTLIKHIKAAMEITRGSSSPLIEKHLRSVASAIYRSMTDEEKEKFAVPPHEPPEWLGDEEIADFFTDPRKLIAAKTCTKPGDCKHVLDRAKEKFRSNQLVAVKALVDEMKKQRKFKHLHRDSLLKIATATLWKELNKAERAYWIGKINKVPQQRVNSDKGHFEYIPMPVEPITPVKCKKPAEPITPVKCKKKDLVAIGAATLRAAEKDLTTPPKNKFQRHQKRAISHPPAH